MGIANEERTERLQTQRPCAKASFVDANTLMTEGVGRISDSPVEVGAGTANENGEKQSCCTDRAPNLISLVITTYNREQFLGAAIESVLAQTYPHFELVVWDDGSTDRSLEIAQAYASRDARVRVIAASHQGRVRSLEGAINETQGAYLGWVDSDDRLDPKALETTIAILRAQPAVGMVYTDYWDVDSADRVLGYGQRCRIPYSKERLLLNFMTFHFRLLRRSVFEAVGGLDDSLDYVEDYDLCLRLSEVTAVRHVDQPLYYYRHHEGNASQQWRLEQVMRSQTVIQRALQRRGLDRQFELQVQLPAGHFSLRRKRHPAKVLTPLWSLLPQVAAVGAIAIMPGVEGFFSRTAQAQSIVPATDGTNTIVTSNGNQFDISGGARSQDGANLFQSFQQFGLTSNQIANFLATPQTRNILGRVVGGDASVINGLIQVTGSSANLYLMNPAGIIFGANASLNVPGAFTATTATGIGLNDRWFSAIGSNDYATLIGDPTAFAFTVTQPGAIVNAGTLAVAAGQRLNVLGGTVVNTGTLTAPGGQITIAAVPGQSLVRLPQPGSLLSFELTSLSAPPGVAADASPPALPNDWTLPIASLPALLTGGNLQSATGLMVNPNGTIRLVAVPQQNIAVEPGTAIASGMIDASGAKTGAFSTGGTVQVLGNQVAAIGATINASSDAGGGTILLGGRERGQGTVPNASSTVVDFSSVVTADGLLNGSGGRVTVWSDNVTQFLGTIRARGGTQAGNGGFVEVSSKGNLAYRGFVDTSAPVGAVGTLLLDPTNITIVSGNGYGSADGQLPTLFSGDFAGTSLTISQNALQNTAGDIILEATNDIVIQPLVNGTLALNPEVISFTLRADADRNGVGSVSMSPGDTITAATGFGTTNISISGANLTLGSLSTATSFANAGTVTLTASGNLTAGAINTSSFEGGMGFGYRGGAVALTAGGSLAVGNITTVGAQNAGSVTLTAQSNVTVGNMTTRAGSTFSRQGSNGGAIAVSSSGGSITTGNLLTTGLSSSGDVTLTAPGTNGNITVTSIDASASQPGSLGGSVTLTAGRFVRGTGFTLSNRSATITTAAGAVTIEHGGGALNVPFIVGDAGTNGTIGAINAGAPDVLSPTRSFPDSFTQGKIQILTTVPTPTPITPPPESPKLPGDDPTDILIDTPEEPPSVESPETTAVGFDDPATTEAALEEDAIGEFDTYLDLPDEIPNVSQDAGTILSQIGDAAGVKPALVYASFVPPNVATNALPVSRARPTTELARHGDKALVATEPFSLKGSDAIGSLTMTKAASRRDRVKHLSSALGQKEAPTNGNDQLELVVVTANGKPIRRLVPGATRRRVLQVVHQFLNEITDPRKNRTTSYLASSQQLYRWLVAPIESELQARGISNLAYIADTGLRFLPMAALHDGQHFLVEKYSIGLMPSLSLTDTRYVSLKKAKVLAMGASVFTDQPPLPAVPTELAVITQDLWTGTALLNQSFTLENLKAERQQEPFQIIHLATHSEFQPGALSNSYIQLWQTKLQLNQLRQLGWNQPPVELLVLSSCRTTLGSDDAELGFAGFAVQAGVKSALASLWYVSDEGTLGLMTEFYRQLRTAPIKAEALRQAQIAMLRGNIQIAEGQLRNARGGSIQLPIALADRANDHPLSHPYYWAAFTLIGSPW